MTTDNRNERLGASDIAAALGISPHKTAWELYAEKRGMLEPFTGNAATRHGQRLESAILDEAESVLGPLERNVQADASWKAGFPLSAQLDSVLKASGVPVEAKTSGITGPVYGHWGDPDSDDIPSHYLVQLFVQCFCRGSDLAHLFALLGGRGIVAYRVPYDPVLGDEIVARSGRWWKRHIIDGIEPDREPAPPLEVVKRLRRVPEKIVTMSAEGAALVEQWELAKDARKTFSDQCDELQAQMLLQLGDAECGLLPDGRQLEYLETSRKGYIVQPTTYRTARIKKQ